MVRVAKRRLVEAEEKLEVVRKWIPVFQQAVFEYQSRARPAGDMLESDLHAAVALLDRMTTALDAYLATAPPPGTRREPASGSSERASSSVAMPLSPATGTIPERTTAEDEPPVEPVPNPEGSDQKE